MPTTPDDPVSRLHAECPVRICAVLHATGEYVHAVHRDTGRVCCYHWSRLPEDAEPTEAQRILWEDEG